MGIELVSGSDWLRTQFARLPPVGLPHPPCCLSCPLQWALILTLFPFTTVTVPWLKANLAPTEPVMMLNKFFSWQPWHLKTPGRLLVPRAVQSTLNYCLIKVSFTAVKQQHWREGEMFTHPTFGSFLVHFPSAIASPGSRSGKETKK